MESTPPPPVGPPPPPPGLVSAPARATVGAGPAEVLAEQGGPNFTTGPTAGTTFPLLQSAMSWNGPRIGADGARNASGGTATVEAGQLRVTYDSSPSSGYADLDWTRIGSWEVPTDWYVEPGAIGSFVVGYVTPPTSVQASGSATYTGRAEGTVLYPLNGVATQGALTGGSASFTADFGARTVAGSITGLSFDGAPWNNFTFNSTIIASSFSGDTRVSSTPDGVASLAGNATGTLEGRFFGPLAEEAGAVWTLFDATNAAIGTLSGRRGP